jgi:prolyl oligopeptidase
MRLNLIASGILLACGQVAAESPLTPKLPATDTYHGIEVVDPYRWLEEGEDPQVKSWSDKQNSIARGVLDNLPGVAELRKEVREVYSTEMIRYVDLKRATGRLFLLKYHPPQQQPTIVTLPDHDQLDAARVIIDPNQIDPSGGTSIDWYRVSPDGQYLAVSLSVGGTELGNLKVYDIERATPMVDAIEGVNSGTAGGSLAWTGDSRGFYYTRHFPVNPAEPSDLRVFQHVYYHRLGTDPAEDRYELGEGFPEIAEIQLVLHDASGYLLSTVQEGDGGNFAHHLRNPDGAWRQFSEFGDGIKQAVFGDHGQLYLVSLHDAPRGKILQVSCESLDVAGAKTLVDQSNDTIVTGGTPFWGEATVLPTDHRLYVVYQLGGPSEVRAFDLQGTPLAEIPQLDIGAVHGLLRLDGDDVMFGNASFVEPGAYYHYSAADNRSQPTKLASSAPIALDNVQVVRRFARSADGTRVPMNIMLPPGATADGRQPCLVTGYGGYGVNNEPRYDVRTALLLRHGVIVAETNLRGGGEFGEGWHRQGNLTHKQNVFDDFAACIRWVIDQGYTRPQRLGIAGGSNGGLLMGATLTQHPELVQAVVSYVGIYDMLRVELSPNGAFNVTEFGTVQDREQFEALYSYSPYHNVIDGVSYPATLFLTGANDPRVDPMQSRKMTARLQAASTSDAPILLRTSANAGHGGGSSLDERIEQTVDVLAFLFQYLGITPDHSR